MNKMFFDELKIPDYHLGVGSGSHGYQTGKMLKEKRRSHIENLNLLSEASEEIKR